ncbi:MAG TPA: TonB-dependent receptor [Vicinamibacterales bacterium]|nr:TonB-dependent receptor [Vicinamibacterales bacterium]
MKLGRLVRLTVAMLALPLLAYAQDATLSGTIKDNTGGVLPGVTVTATNEASGITFTSVTDERGIYRLPVRAGVYKITAELAGFTTVTRPGIEMLLGRQVALDLNLQVSSLQETVTVTGEAPLLDTSSSTIASNIDPRQMQDIPINGRNWMDLTMLSAGSRTNASSEVPQDRQGFFQTNVDGQSVTLTVCCAQNQPRYSRDSIAEFQLTTNRFDATQGRTMGMMVNAITKSGTNAFAGTVGGYFRRDNWNAADFVQKKVLPYKDSQLSGTFGGPIIKDRIHFFGNYEYERNPQTFGFGGPTGPFATCGAACPNINLNLNANYTLQQGGGKVDVQLSPKNRLSGRYSHYKNLQPIQTVGALSTTHPSNATQNNRFVDQYFATYTSVLSNNTINEIKGGLAANFYTLEPVSGWGLSGSRRPPETDKILFNVFSGREIEGGAPGITFAGYTIGSPTNTPQRTGEHNFQFRDDFTTAYELAGRHDVKMGGDFIKYTMSQGWCNVCDGLFASTSRAPANLEQLLPDWRDASTWNFNAMAVANPAIGYTGFRDYNVTIGNMSYSVHRQIYAAWYQDDWKVGPKLTLNMGVRYDLDHGAQGEAVQFLPWLSGKRPTDKNNAAPRLGFAYQVNEKSVIRGGWGVFFTELEDDALHQSYILTQNANITLPNNGRADFGTNPFGGPKPTLAQITARRCDIVGLPFNSPNCYPQSIRNGSEIPVGDHPVSYSHMVSFGFQRELAANTGLDSNFVFTGGRAEERRQNLNSSINPATGANYTATGAATDVAHLPFPSWGPIAGEIMNGRSNYYGWENTFTKRFSNRWQANATYTLSYFKDDGGIGNLTGPFLTTLDPAANITTILTPYTGTIAPDMGPMYQLTATDQRHRATFNGIWEMGGGFQLSGVYFFGSGERRNTNWGSDLRNTGGANYGILTPAGTTAESLTAQLNPDVRDRVGSITGQVFNGQFLLDRAQLVGQPIHRVDTRIQKRFSLGGRRNADLMLELFNIFNHANYGAYTTTLSNPAQFGLPSQNLATAYQPRVLQLGFHLAF